MTSNICIIGSGNVGSRHFQSLGLLNRKTNIFVIDPSKENRNKAQKLFFESVINRENFNIFFHEKIKNFNVPIDVSIISTNSDVRRKVIEQLTSTNDIKNMILEKVVFQKMSDYNFISNMLNKKNIKCFVNLTRRFYGSYQSLKKTIEKEKEIYMSHNCSFALGSNSIHFLDLFMYLTNTKKIMNKQISLKKKIYESSRKGFIEFKGTLQFSSERGDILYLSDFGLGKKENKHAFGGIVIESKNFSYLINEGFQKIVKLEYNQGLNVNVDNFYVPKQSVITNEIVDSLLNNENIALPTLEETYYAHNTILEIFTTHLSNTNNNIEGCPIT